MAHIKHMVDMARSPEKVQETQSMPAAVAADQPVYPYGLSISLGKDELEKLGVDHADWQVGDIFHLHALAKVTSVSSHETEGGESCRVELQITHLSGESEDAENEDDEENEPEENSEEDHPPEKQNRRRNMYF